MTDSAYTSLLQHFAHYFDAVDTADFDAVLAILDGATVRAGQVETSDPEAIRKAYAASHLAPDEHGRRAAKNHLTNLRVDGPDDTGRWTASAYYFRLEPAHDGVVVGTSGRLRQSLSREADRWRVHTHEIITDF